MSSNSIQVNRTFSNRIRSFIKDGSPATITTEAGDPFYDAIMSQVVDNCVFIKAGATTLITKGAEPIRIPVVKRTDDGGFSSEGFSVATLDVSPLGLARSPLVMVPGEILQDLDVDLASYLTLKAGRFLAAALTDLACAQLTPAYITDMRYRPGTAEDFAALYNSIIAPYRAGRDAAFIVGSSMRGPGTAKLYFPRDAKGYPAHHPRPDHWPSTDIFFGDWSQFLIRFVPKITLSRKIDYSFGSAGDPGVEVHMLGAATLVDPAGICGFRGQSA